MGIKFETIKTVVCSMDTVDKSDINAYVRGKSSSLNVSLKKKLLNTLIQKTLQRIVSEHVMNVYQANISRDLYKTFLYREVARRTI